MVSASAALGFAGLCLALAAVELFTFLDAQCGAATGTTTSADEAPPLLHSAAAEALPPLAAVGVLFVAAALTYRHLIMVGRHAAAAGGCPVAGAGNRRRSVSGLLMFALCVSTGTLELIVFRGSGAGPAGAEEVRGAQARALGVAALRALPAAAAGTFFSGMALIIVAHVRAGGEGGGGGRGAVAGDGALIQGLLRLLLANVAAGAAAALVGLMVMALTLLNGGAKY